MADLLTRSRQFVSPRPDGAQPNPPRWTLFAREAASGTTDDARYVAVRDHVLPAVRVIVEGLFEQHQLDAIVYPTSPRRPALLASGGTGAAPGGAPSATNIANLTGFPDLIVPAGFTGDRLPVGISFFGRAFSEARLLALGYSFEQATNARRLPVHTPALPGEEITVP